MVTHFDSNQPAHRALAMLILALLSLKHRVDGTHLSQYMVDTWPAALPAQQELAKRFNPSDRACLSMLRSMTEWTHERFQNVAHACAATVTYGVYRVRPESVTSHDISGGLEPASVMHAAGLVKGKHSDLCLFALLKNGLIVTQNETVPGSGRSTCSI